MTDSATTPAAAEPKAKRTYDRTPWRIYCLETGNRDEVGSELRLQSLQDFKDLRECESACSKMAIENPGRRYQPVKVGVMFMASKVERVEVKRA